MTTNEPQDFDLPEYSGNPFIAKLPPILSLGATWTLPETGVLSEFMIPSLVADTNLH